jgi:peptide/nickel transport system permease protein
MSYILRRLGFYAVAAWASLTLNFLLPRLMPGDPAIAIFARFEGQMDPSAIDSMREAYGLSDDPLLVQYVSYLSHAVRGDFGTSISYFPAPVLEVIATGLYWTLLLGFVSLLVSCVIGCLLGVLGAWHRDRVLDSYVPPFFILVGSFPYFWLATLALFFFSFKYEWFPLRHAYDQLIDPGFNAEFLLSVGQHIFLPAMTVVLVSIGGWLLGMRNSMIGVLAEDYVTMAEAKGLPQRRVMYSYAARNAMLPMVTSFGMSLGFLLSGSLLTEVVFSYPGMGFLFLTAVRSSDYPLIQGLFLMITFAVLTANLIVDLLYVRLDPRVGASS